jgi:hypothetical protein
MHKLIEVESVYSMASQFMKEEQQANLDVRSVLSLT